MLAFTSGKQYIAIDPNTGAYIDVSHQYYTLVHDGPPYRVRRWPRHRVTKSVMLSRAQRFLDHLHEEN